MSHAPVFLYSRPPFLPHLKVLSRATAWPWRPPLPVFSSFLCCHLLCFPSTALFSFFSSDRPPYLIGASLRFVPILSMTHFGVFPLSGHTSSCEAFLAYHLPPEFSPLSPRDVANRISNGSFDLGSLWFPFFIVLPPPLRAQDLANSFLCSAVRFTSSEIFF